MKRKLSLLLAMVLAMTMVMGIGVTAFALEGNGSADNPYILETFAAGDQISLGNSSYVKALDGTGYFHVYDSDKTNLIYYCTVSMGYSATISSASVLPLKSYEKLEFWEREGSTYKFVGFLKSTPTPSIAASSPAHEHNFQWQTIYEATPNSDGLEGEVCSCGATRNTSVISAMDYAINKYADQMIKAAKPGQKITLEFGEFNSFPRYMMEKVAARMNENITFVFKFKQNKKMQTVTIEPGTAIDLQYDWYGPDKMKELYGAE